MSTLIQPSFQKKKKTPLLGRSGCPQQQYSQKNTKKKKILFTKNRPSFSCALFPISSLFPPPCHVQSLRYCIPAQNVQISLCSMCHPSHPHSPVVPLPTLFCFVLCAKGTSIFQKRFFKLVSFNNFVLVRVVSFFSFLWIVKTVSWSWRLLKQTNRYS